jgi:hypothetical protein
MNSAVISKHTFTNLRKKFKFFGRAEIDELEKILVPGETILEVLNGFYTGGFAVLCATNLRLLLVDKKLFMLTVEDVRFDSINEIDYHSRILDASAIIHTPSKQLKFTSWRQRDLRSLVTFVQRHIMQLRQQAAQQSVAARQYPALSHITALRPAASSAQPSIINRAPNSTVAKVESNTFDEASMRRLAYILRRPRIGKFLLGQ